jgi:ribulose-5-phosphate 4-epimerase/fuculose-1-phosphate aldolase
VENKAQQARNGVVQAGRILSGLGLVTAFGHVSQRTGARMLITPAADLTEVTAAGLVHVDLAATSLPAGAPAEAWAHLAVYAARPDVMSVARAQPPAVFAAAAALSGRQPPGPGSGRQPPGPGSGRRPPGPGSGPVTLPLLYGQACWLGANVPVHADARLLRSAVLGQAAAAALGPSDALLLRGNGALTCGPTLAHAVTRMWLLAAACQAWLAASAAGQPAALTGAEIESWRAVQGELLPRLWPHLTAVAGGPRPGTPGAAAGPRGSDHDAITDGGLADG